MIRRAPKAERTLDGIVFDSKAEMLRYQELRLLERAGVIKNLRLQPKFPLIINGNQVLIRSKRYPNGRQAVYKADFGYIEVENSEDWPLRETIEDSKGYATEAARLRIAVVEAIYNVRVKITGGGKYRTKKQKYRLEDLLNA